MDLTKIEQYIPLVIPSTAIELSCRMALIEKVDPISFKSLKSILTKTEVKRTQVNNLIKNNQINSLDKICLLVHYYGHQDSNPLELFDISKNTISDVKYRHQMLIELYELPRIRAKLAVLEVIYAKVDCGSDFLNIIEICDLYLRSEKFMDHLDTLRDIKFYLGKDESASMYANDSLKEIYSTISTDQRKSKKHTIQFSILKWQKFAIEQHICLLRKNIASEIEFKKFLNNLNLITTEIINNQLKNHKKSASEIALDILVESGKINSARSFWDKSKTSGSVSISNWVEMVYGFKFPNEILQSPLTRSHKVWKPLENFKFLPSIWSDISNLPSIHSLAAHMISSVHGKQNAPKSRIK